MGLLDALGAPAGMLAAIGAGGKTTVLLDLARALRDRGERALFTTTTKIWKPEPPPVDRLCLADDPERLREILAASPSATVVAAGRAVDSAGKLVGFPPQWLDGLAEAFPHDWILVEADGASGRLFKVPAEHEPVVPRSSTVTLWIMSIKVLGKPLSCDWVHRAERALALLGLPRGTQLEPAHILRLVEEPAGCWKGIPVGSRKVALVNQVETDEELEGALALGKGLLARGAERVVIASYLREEPVIQLLVG